MSGMVAQLPLFRRGDEEYCCLRRFVAEQLLLQGVRPDSITEIALLAKERDACGHLSALYMLLAQHTASVIDANATGIIRLLGLNDVDADAFRTMNRRQRSPHMVEAVKSCSCKIAETPPWAA